MTQRNDSSHAIVLLPSGLGGRIDPAHRRWLAAARLSLAEPRAEPLLAVLKALELEAPAGGLAALRLWGQTGERPSGWLAAADPVYLEASLDRLRLHALSGAALPRADLRAVFDLLHNEFRGNGASEPLTFVRVAELGYLRSDAPMTTASASAAIADGQAPDTFLPRGAPATELNRLQSEVQMCLHECGVNLRRDREGLPLVNSLWFWGGGTAPVTVEGDLPVLLADEPLFRGYWQCAGARVDRWPGSLEACADRAPAGFVAITPDASERRTAATETLNACLKDLRRLLSRGRLRRATLLFADGLTADIRRADRLRFWRRRTTLLDAAP